ncbi:MAG: hypothetical protein AAB691_02210 [Patescibacteria group bacterium]
MIKGYQFRVIFFLATLLGVLLIFSPAFAAQWECRSTGLSFSDAGFCRSQCGGVSCVCSGSASECGGGNNPFATDQTPYPHTVVPPNPGPVNDVFTMLGVLTSVIELAQIIFWILTVGFGLYGSYLYLFAAGNAEKAIQARKVFLYAVIAGVLAILSYSIPGIVESFVLGY